MFGTAEGETDGRGEGEKPLPLKDSSEETPRETQKATLGELESESEESGELYLDVPRESATTARDPAVESEEEGEIMQEEMEELEPRRKMVAFLLVVIILLFGALGFFAYKYFELKERDSEVEYLRAEVETWKSNYKRLEDERDLMKNDFEKEREDWKVKEARYDSIVSISVKHMEREVDLKNLFSFESSIQNNVVMIAIENEEVQDLQMLREIFAKKICDLQKLLFIQSALKRGNVDATKILLSFETTNDMFQVLQPSEHMITISKEMCHDYNQRLYNTLQDVIITIVTIGDADVFDQVLRRYGKYTVMFEILHTSLVESAKDHDIYPFRESVFSIATAQAFDNKIFDVQKVLRRYENDHGIHDLVVNIEIYFDTGGREFRKEKADKLRREGIYIELMALSLMDWKVMTDYYMENFVQPQDHDFYLKKAREDRNHAMVQLLLEQQDKLQSQ